MLNKSERRMAVDVFGNLKGYHITTDAETVNIGDEITLVNNNCEFSFDNIFGIFQTDLLFNFKVDLELLETDYSEFVPDKSNNGGAYAYATCKITKIYEEE